LFIPRESARHGKEAVSHFRFQLFDNPPYVGRQFKILCPQTVFYNPLRHQPKMRSSAPFTDSEGSELK